MVRSWLLQVGELVRLLSLTVLQMFQYPWFITMTVAITRMYRALQDFSSPVVYDIHSFLHLLFPLTEHVWS